MVLINQCTLQLVFPPYSMGSLKSRQPDTPLRPIVSSCGSVTYCEAKECTKILKPLVGKSPHHINSTHDFVEQVKHITLAPGECLSSYEVSALFTSVPVDPALQVIKDLLEKRCHPQGKNSTPCGKHHSTIRLCLKNMYFSFQGQFYEQVNGAAMVSPVSPIVANFIYGVCMEYRIWDRYVDDTFVIQNESINRTSYNTSTVLTLPFSLQWRTIWSQRLMGKCLPLCTGKPTHTDQYLQWNSHTISQPSLVLSTLPPIGPNNMQQS